MKEKFEGTKDVIKSSKSKDRQHNDHKKGQKDKQKSTKHHTQNKGSRNTNPTKTGVNSCVPER
jgi:hypothetical protein